MWRRSVAVAVVVMSLAAACGSSGGQTVVSSERVAPVAADESDVPVRLEPCSSPQSAPPAATAGAEIVGQDTYREDELVAFRWTAITGDYVQAGSGLVVQCWSDDGWIDAWVAGVHGRRDRQPYATFDLETPITADAHDETSGEFAIPAGAPPGLYRAVLFLDDCTYGPITGTVPDSCIFREAEARFRIAPQDSPPREDPMVGPGTSSISDDDDAAAPLGGAGCTLLPPDSLTVDEAFVPFGAQRGRHSGETPILTSYERAGAGRDAPRELTTLTHGHDFGGRTLALGFTISANEGSEEYEYYLAGELDEVDTHTSFLRKGGIVVTATTSPYDDGLAGALLEGSEHPAAAPVNPTLSTVPIGDHLGVLNLADPIDPEGTRPYRLSWHVDGIDFYIRGVVADASELVNWGRALQCRP